MRARELAQPFPTVGLDTDAMEAARMLGQQRLPGLIVLGDDGRPWTVLPASQVLRLVIPAYVQDDPALARAFDEKASDQLWSELDESTVRDMLPAERDVDELPVVDPDATTVEVAAVMARVHSPLVAVVDGDELLGAITVSRLLDHLLPGPATRP
ncbi:MAG TPA: CBS domain-containing protein [Actinomycetes bacterium]